MTAAIYIYLADVINNIGIFLSIIGFGGITIFGFITAVLLMHEEKYHGRDWGWIVPTVCLTIACFIPSSKTMYMMAGAVIGEQALESKVGQQLKEMLELKLEHELKKAKDELTKEKK